MRYFEKLAIEYNEPQKRVANVLQNPNQSGLLLYWNVGSGKTMGAINVANKLKAKSTVVVPASLQENFKKELRKTHTKETNFDIKSYEKFIKNPVSDNKDLLIIDEAHRIRDLGTKRSQTVLNASKNYKKTLLLTGTPIVNKPFDIVPLINTAAGQKRLPENEDMFNKIFVSKTVNSPGLLSRFFLGKHTTVKHNVRNKDLFKKQTDDVVDYFSGTSPKDFPKREDTRIYSTMSPSQVSLYKFYEKKLPMNLRSKIEQSIPPDRKDVSKLNSFLSATRQLSNTTGSFTTTKEMNPKITKILDIVKQEKGPSVVYSNYLDSGLNPLAEELKKNKISYGLFTGKQSGKEKNQLVKDYNEGKTKALLISSSGGEGLDLKNTSAVHIMEPHWNDPKIEQVIGRTIRYKSHSNPDSKVKVYKHTSRFPEEKSIFNFLFSSQPKQKPTTDDYLYNLSVQKKKLNDKFLELLK